MTDLEPAALPAPRRVRLLGVPMDCVNMMQAVAVADDMVRSNRQGTILAINPEKIIGAAEQPKLRDALDSAALLIPDGIGAVMAARLRGVKGIERVPGAELMPRLCALARDRGYGIYLYGGRPEVNQRAAERLPELYPGLKIAGRHHGFLDEREQEALIHDINRSGAQILFVALGSPRQEVWMNRHLKDLTTVRVCQGVGGTFDVIAGRVRRAPAAWRALNLEWFYRFLQEPQRARRLPALVHFTWRVVREGLGRPS